MHMKRPGYKNVETVGRPHYNSSDVPTISAFFEIRCYINNDVQKRASFEIRNQTLQLRVETDHDER